MDARPPSLGLVADRRIREDAARTAPRLDVRGPVSSSRRTIGAADERARTPDRQPGAGLTRRERRVKAILLKELERMNGEGKQWISYQERRKLFDTLDVDFIDREIATMERRLRPRPWLTVPLALLALAYPGVYIGGAVGEPLSWATGLQVVLGLAMPASLAFSWVAGRRALRRRLWIYQALRELSDAEDEGVQLDESVRLADLLIDRIVDADESAARTPLHRIRT